MPITDWQPALTDVGAVLRLRTRDDTGATLGTFTSATTPTDAEVVPLIDSAAGDVATVIGTDIPAGFWDQAKTVASIGTAMLIELGFFADQVAAGRSPFEALQGLYNVRLGRLKTAIDSSGESGPEDADQLPQGGFGRSAAVGCGGWPDAWNGDLFPGITWPAVPPW